MEVKVLMATVLRSLGWLLAEARYFIHVGARFSLDCLSRFGLWAWSATVSMRVAYNERIQERMLRRSTPSWIAPGRMVAIKLGVISRIVDPLSKMSTDPEQFNEYVACLVVGNSRYSRDLASVGAMISRGSSDICVPIMWRNRRVDVGVSSLYPPERVGDNLDLEEE